MGVMKRLYERRNLKWVDEPRWSGPPPPAPDAIGGGGGAGLGLGPRRCAALYRRSKRVQLRMFVSIRSPPEGRQERQHTGP